MAIINFGRKKLNESQSLQETSRKAQLDVSTILNLPYYNSIQRLQNMGTARGQYSITSEVKKAMLRDPLISRVINMWISDTLSKDVLTHEVYLVDVTKADDTVTDNELNEINDAINYLRENSNLEELLPQILYNIIVWGSSSVKLGFVDGFEDTNIKLFESNKKKILNETSNWNEDTVKKLLEAPNYDDYLLDDNGTGRKRKKLVKLSGRYFIEMLPKRMVPLRHKGITILYLDLDNTTKVLNPKNITSFINMRGGTKTLSLKENSDDVVSDLYELPMGESFIDNAVTPWSMLNSVEDCTMLALMTRSAIYRLFQIDVGAMSTEETEKLVQEFKTRLTSRETINVREQYYSSANTQLPLGDSIVIPTRNGVGTISLQTVGNDLKLDTDGPLKYFREQLLSALGVPEGLIYGDTGNGGLINTSATKQDIRYLRTIQQFTSILSQGLISLFKDYLKMIGVDISKITLDINFAQINNEQDVERIEYEQAKQDALQRAIDSLSSLGITFDGGAYKGTRDLLISRYLDSELLDKIKEDEKNGNGAVEEPSGEEEKGSSHGPMGGPPPSINNNIDLGGPEEGNEEDLGTEEGSEGGNDEIMSLDDNPEVAPGSETPENRPPFS
jgi:hypothetical protein